MNNVSLTGRITKDPEIRYTPNGNAYTLFSIAVDRPFVKDVTDFINCVAWNSNADFIGRYVKKGNLLEIVGTLQTRVYTNQSNESVKIVEVIVDNVRNITPKPKDDIPQPTPPQNQVQKPQQQNYNPQYQNPQSQNSQQNQNQVYEEDLPF